VTAADLTRCVDQQGSSYTSDSVFRVHVLQPQHSDATHPADLASITMNDKDSGREEGRGEEGGGDALQVHVYVCVCACARPRTCVECVFIRVSVCMYACMYASVCVCLSVCLSVRVCAKT
jgi:hypothetical protein